MIGKTLSKQNSKEKDPEKPIVDNVTTTIGSSKGSGDYGLNAKNDKIITEQNLPESSRRRSSKNVQDPLGLFARKPLIGDTVANIKPDSKANELKANDGKKTAGQDWLGIDANASQGATIQNTTTEPDLPSWLGGSGNKTAQKKITEKVNINI